jgi:hypothetical protein
MMRVQKVLALLLLLLAWGDGLMANSAAPYSPHHAYLGVDFSFQRHAFQHGPTSTGSLWGVAGEYDYICNRCWYVGTEVSWDTGHLSDDFRRKTVDLDVQGRWGYTCFGRWRCLEGYLIPFVGIGFRHLRQEVFINDSVTPNYLYNLWYVPIGFRCACLWRCWEAGLNFQFRWTVDSTRHDASGVVRTVLDEKFGFGIQLPLIWRVQPKRRCGWEIRGVPFWKWERFGDGGIAPADSQFDEQDWGFFLQFGVRV